MFRDRELTAALAVMAAVAGTGFASGREVVLFFSQAGWAAWPGMIAAAALFAVILRIVMGFARKTGAQSLPEVFRRLLGAWCGNTVSVLYGLLMAFTAAMMLRTCAELGALALPVKNGRLWGLIAAILLSATILAGRRRLLPGFGAAAVIAAVVFYGALMLDTRPVRVNMRYETVLNLSGSLWAALVLALLHACLNGSVAGGAAAAFAGGNFNVRKAALLAGGMMLMCLLCAHCAVLRGGDVLYAQMLPVVILAARWGIWGFWLSAGFMYFSCVCTLSAALSAIVSNMKGTGRLRPGAGAMFFAAFLLTCIPAAGGFLGFGYPVLGWLCAFFVAALACLRERKTIPRAHSEDRLQRMKKMTEIDVKF